MKEQFAQESEGLREALQNVEEFHAQIEKAVLCIKEAFARGNRLYTAGNGGSAAEAQHLAEELLGRYKNARKSYPAISLTADGTTLTCIGNDFGFENIFARQIEGLGQKGDVLVVLSTSGDSKNLVRAAAQALKMGVTVIALVGRKGVLREIADLVIEAPSDTNARVQELHLHAIHLMCHAFEV